MPLDLPSPLHLYAHVVNYPRKNEPVIVKIIRYSFSDGPFIVCDVPTLRTAGDLPFQVPTRGTVAVPEYAHRARVEANLKLLREWAKAAGLEHYPDEIEARAAIGEIPLEADRGDLGPWVTLVNPSDREWQGTVWLFSFGAMGSTFLAVWGDGDLSEALETAAGWLADHAPGHIMPMGSEEHRELVAEAREELGPDATDEAVFEQAEADLTYTESGFLTSYEWHAREADGDLYDRLQALAAVLHPSEDGDEDEDEED